MSCIPIVLFSNVVVKWTYNIAFIIFRMVMIQVTILLLCKINHQACVCVVFFFFFKKILNLQLWYNILDI